MDDAIQYRIGKRRIREQSVPLCPRILAGDQQRSAAHAPVDDIEPHVPDGQIDLAVAEIVDQQQRRFDQPRFQRRGRTIGQRHRNIGEQLRTPIVNNEDALPAGLSAQCARQPGFSNPRRFPSGLREAGFPPEPSLKDGCDKMPYAFRDIDLTLSRPDNAQSS